MTDHACGPLAPCLVMLTPADGTGSAWTVAEADPRQPQILVTDQGLTRGDGLFETALAVPDDAGHLRVRKLEAHLQRLAGSAAALRLPVPGADDWRAAIETALRGFAAHARAAGSLDARGVVRLTATSGPEPAEERPGGASAWVLVSPAPAPDPELRDRGLDALLLDRGLDSRSAERAPWLLTEAKTLSYAINMAALRHAREQGADDVVFVSADGQLLEGPTSTMLLARRDRQGRRELVTPLRRQGILAGTSQAVVFAGAEAAGWRLGYGPLVPADLLGGQDARVEGVWLVSSVRGLMPVRSLRGEGVDIPQLPVDAELTATLEGYLRQDLPAGPHGSASG